MDYFKVNSEDMLHLNKIAKNIESELYLSKVAKAIELEAEEVLLHAEQVVKEFVPARQVKSTLLKIEKALDKEGIEAEFNKAITREYLRATASEKADECEIDELVDAIVKAIVDEFEEILKDADEVLDEHVLEFEDQDLLSVEASLKNNVEDKMKSIGIHCKFYRTSKPSEHNKKIAFKTKTKKTLLDKIKSSK